MVDKVYQTVIGGFHRDHTLRHEICGSCRTVTALLGANRRGRKRSQVGGKIQSRTLVTAGFQVLIGWLLIVERLKRCALCRHCMAFGRSWYYEVVFRSVPLLIALQSFQALFYLLFPSGAHIRKESVKVSVMAYEASSSSNICRLLFTVHESPRVLHRVHGASVVLMSHLTLT
jgi:hypothetical protein